MPYEIPFKDTATEIKPLISGITKGMELENISSSIKKAKSDIIDVVGEDIWELMINHYNDEDHYNQDNETNENYIRLNKLVKYIQDPLAHFALYRHFIWLIIRVSDTGVTVPDPDGERTAYKYLTDEAKNTLIANAWESINTLIEFLNKEATNYTEWEKETAYMKDQIVTNENTYYKAIADFTSGATFSSGDWTEITKSITATDWTKNTDYITGQIVRYDNTYYQAASNFTSGSVFTPGNWTELTEPSEVVFWQWTESDQFTDSKNLLFEDHKDFHKYFGIDKSAYFFVKARYLILEIIEDDIQPVHDLATIYKQLKGSSLSTQNNKILSKIKRYLAYETIARACLRFDYHEIPGSIRVTYDNEMKRSDKDKNPTFIKEKLSKAFANKAKEYLDKLERYLNTLTRKEDPEDTDTPTAIADENVTELTDEDKFYSVV